MNFKSQITNGLTLVALTLILGCGTGLDVSELASTSPEADTSTKAYTISIYDNTVCVIGRSGQLKCFGNGSNNKTLRASTNNIGDGANEMGDSLPAVDLGTGKTAISIAVGGYTTCVALNDNTVKCAGNNGWGALGRTHSGVYGSQSSHYGDSWPTVSLGSQFKAVKVYAASLHNCALSDEGKAKCWGSNHHGTLGLGVSTSYVGTSDAHMGDNLPFVNVGTSRTIKDLALGASHGCALLDNNQIKCWGQGTFHALGYENTTSRGQSASDMGDNLPYVNLGTNRTAKKIFASDATTCAILDNDELKCWGGQNNYGGLGQGHTNSIGGNSGDMGDNLLAIDLGTNIKSKNVGLTGYSGCSVAQDNTIRCWGKNGFGVLGLGTNTVNIGDNSNEMGDNLTSFHLGSNEKIVNIVMNNYTGCAALDGYKLKCWGQDSQGSLGQGTSSQNLGDANFELGDYIPSIDLGTNF